MNQSKFEYWQSDNFEWYFRLKASNGKIICQSEGYTRKQSCLDGIKAVRAATQNVKVVEVDG